MLCCLLLGSKTNEHRINGVINRQRKGKDNVSLCMWVYISTPSNRSSRSFFSRAATWKDPTQHPAAAATGGGHPPSGHPHAALLLSSMKKKYLPDWACSLWTVYHTGHCSIRWVLHSHKVPGWSIISSGHKGKHAGHLPRASLIQGPCAVTE